MGEVLLVRPKNIVGRPGPRRECSDPWNTPQERRRLRFIAAEPPFSGLKFFGRCRDYRRTAVVKSFIIAFCFMACASRRFFIRVRMAIGLSRSTTRTLRARTYSVSVKRCPRPAKTVRGIKAASLRSSPYGYPGTWRNDSFPGRDDILHPDFVRCNASRRRCAPVTSTPIRRFVGSDAMSMPIAIMVVFGKDYICFIEKKK